MTDGEDEDVATLLAHIGEEQERLRALLAGKDEAFLAQRPPSGRWSVVENVRHLLFAEHAHFGRVLPGGVRFDTPGLPPQPVKDVRRQRMVGTEATGLAELLAAWAALHERASALAGEDTGPARRALFVNLRHLRAHVAVIERLLRTHPH